MTKIYGICGFIGAGKTTYAKQLADTTAAFRWSPDEWMIPLFGEHMPRELFDQRLNSVTDLFKKATLQLSAIGVPVIFDFGFWQKAKRDEFRQWALAHQLDLEMHYLNVPYSVCKQRALQRNTEITGQQAYQMTEDMLELFWSRFEVPKVEEQLLWVEP